jgi:hypothetical protein
MSQPVIKLVLLAALAVVALFALRGSTKAIHRVVWRGVVVLGLVAAALSVVFPGGLTWVAHKVGVGRGADLVLYVMVVAFMMVTVILFRRIADLERRYVGLARLLALRDADESEQRHASGRDVDG